MASGRKANHQVAQKKNRSSNTGRQQEQLGIFQEIFLLAALGFCILLFFSGFGIGGRATDSISEVLFGAFGMMSYIFPVLLFLGIFFIVVGEDAGKMISKAFSSIVIFLSLCVLLQVFTDNEGFNPQDIQGYFSYSMMFKKGGGAFGGIAYNWISGMMGRIGAAVVCGTEAGRSTPPP